MHVSYCLFQLQYRMPLPDIKQRILQLTVWNYNKVQENTFLGAVYIKLIDAPLHDDTGQWYQLQNLQ